MACPGFQMSALLHREAVEQSVAAGAAQVVLRATARRVRVPGCGPRMIDGAGAVMMTHERRAIGSAFVQLPQVASKNVPGNAVPSGTRARQDVVLVGFHAAVVHRLTSFVERCFLGDVVLRVQLIDIPRDQHALRVVPRTRTDTIARVDDAGIVQCLALSAQISTLHATPAPAACASDWQCRSLHRGRRGRRLLPGPALVTKNVMSFGPPARGESIVSQPTSANAAIARHPTSKRCPYCLLLVLSRMLALRLCRSRDAQGEQV